MLREAVLTSAISGIIAALLFALLQAFWVTPLILQGETFEDAAEAVTAHEHSDAAGSQHHHDPEAWKPKEGSQRTLFTVAADLLMGIGYAFVLTAAYLLWREPTGPLQGLAFGLAGFCVFFVAPGLGLPPELPGTAAADLASRQQWWALIASTTAAGLVLMFSRRNWCVRVVAVALILLPHLVRAPQPAVESSLAPADLQSQFRLATTMCNGIFWLCLGAASAVVFRKVVGTRGTGPPHI
jgi:cobalt transporter subunit CbtA